MFTTNEEDQREAARLQARLRDADAETDSARENSDKRQVANVSIDEGTHKYVLISAVRADVGGGERQHFVVSRRGAAYHRDAAEPFVEELERCGYSRINILGGGRIALNSEKKTISIYGYSYGFGLVSMFVLQE